MKISLLLHTYVARNFSIFRPLKSTACKALKPIWPNSNLNFSKMVFFALLARLDYVLSRLKVSKNLLFSSKMACFKKLDQILPYLTFFSKPGFTGCKNRFLVLWNWAKNRIFGIIWSDGVMEGLTPSMVNGKVNI